MQGCASPLSGSHQKGKMRKWMWKIYETLEGAISTPKWMAAMATLGKQLMSVPMKWRSMSQAIVHRGDFAPGRAKLVELQRSSGTT